MHYNREYKTVAFYMPPFLIIFYYIFYSALAIASSKSFVPAKISFL